MAKKAKGTVGDGFRKIVEDKTPPLPRGREAKRKERARRKNLAKGSELSSEELQQRQCHRTRIVSSGKARGSRAANRVKAIKEFQ